MPKVILEREKCIGCGSCAALCPKYFEIPDNDDKVSLKGSVRNQKTNADELEVKKIECIQEAADSCPVQAIRIET